MTEQTERSLTEQPADTERLPYAEQARAPALSTTAPPLAEPRPLRETRTWPRDFTDRLTAPLPGVREGRDHLACRRGRRACGGRRGRCCS
ncbi:hypothetical protein [Streptomyces lydicus]|uniref:hypothetical protein n=1 Tax=Streptomyces lydicus TaxID=47763 RepID=UPI003D9DB7B7